MNGGARWYHCCSQNLFDPERVDGDRVNRVHSTQIEGVAGELRCHDIQNGDAVRRRLPSTDRKRSYRIKYVIIYVCALYDYPHKHILYLTGLSVPSLIFFPAKFLPKPLTRTISEPRRKVTPLKSLKCLAPGSGRKIPAIWHGAGAYHGVSIPETSCLEWLIPRRS